MARLKGSAEFAINFEPTGQAPLDARLVVPTLADLTAAETYIANNYYKGMTVTVQEDGSIWTLMNPDNIVSINSWKQQTQGQNEDPEITVIDSLDSDDPTKALSARQGKILNEKIQNSIVDKLGQAGGIASLDENGKVPASQLPSYVDDVIEYESREAFPEEGESGKVYVDLATNKTYRWGGSEYVTIGSDLALGETSETAWAGDKGKATQEHVDRLQEDVNYIANTVIPEMNSNTAKALDQKVDWDETKSVISLPVKGSIAAIRPGQETAENPEGSLLIGQRVYNVEGEELVVTEIGSTKNDITLNSKSGKVKVDISGGISKTVAYEEDLQESNTKITALETAVGKPAEEGEEATGIYKTIEDTVSTAVEDGLSWYEA